MQSESGRLIVTDEQGEGLVRALSAQGGAWAATSPDGLHATAGITVVVRGCSDKATSDMLRTVMTGIGEGAQVVAFFPEEAAARLYKKDGIQAVGTHRLVAQNTVREFPPVLRGEVAAPPIIIGDGPVARELALAVVNGWGYPGDPLVVNCLGPDHGWALEATMEAGSRADMQWGDTPLSPTVMVSRVKELIGAWTPPPSTHAQVTGPTVFVALTDPVRGLVIAQAVAAAVPDARVVAVVEGDDGVQPEGVDVVSVLATLAAFVAGEDTGHRGFQVSLLEDLAWEGLETSPATAPPVPLFTRPVFESDSVVSLNRQPDGLQEELVEFESALPAILAAGSLEISTTEAWASEPLILTPGELSAMADQILQVQGLTEEPEARLAALELAFRLPRIAARAGMVLRRPHGHRPVLTQNDVEKLAPLVHHIYVGAARETNNATGSPFAYSTWNSLREFEKSSNRAAIVGSAIAWASEGLDWTRSEQVRVVDVNGTQEDRLAELEHRRWAHHQRSNGREAHNWNKPWGQLGDDGQSYDRRIVKGMPGLLASVGVEVR